MKEFLLNSFSHQSIMIQGVNIYLAMCHVVATANHQPVSTNRAMPCSIRECKWGQMKRYFSCITEVPLDLAHDMHKSFKYFEGVKLTSIGSISPPDSSLSSSSLSLADLFFLWQQPWYDEGFMKEIFRQITSLSPCFEAHDGGVDSSYWSA